MKFSIICLTYKRPELLGETVYSVLQQTCQDWELLIINDYYSHTIRFNHPQIRIFNLGKKFKTLGEKRNFGKEQAIGDLILQLDDDDFIFPTYLTDLQDLIGDRDWLCTQRPILYYKDPKKICLSYESLSNTFLYRRLSVGKNCHYDNVNFDELTPFYQKVKLSGKWSGVFRQLPKDKYGYVWRQDIDDKRKYAMSEFRTETLDEQSKIFDSMESKNGNLFLTPAWNKDYITIIRKNFRFRPPSPETRKMMSGSDGLAKLVKDAKKNSESWQMVKPTWENAIKFLDAVKSRGLVSTALDTVGISKLFGNRVSEEIFQRRKLSCFGDKEKNIDSCSRLKYVQSRGYFCGSCGCGENDLARLDADSPDEYTKLHYPELQCPLKRKGFSNEEKNTISIVITVLNESPEILQRTIQSIRDTAGNDPEIIVIDDDSDVPVKTEEHLIRNSRRIGVGGSRHVGAQAASHDYLFFTDAHMIFELGWYEKVLQYLYPLDNNVAYCGTCLGLNDQVQDITKSRGKYYGAELILYDEKRQTIIEGKWTKGIKDKDNYEISCMMGAMYFIPKALYFKVRGFSDLKMWGSSEPCICTKIWLAGGEIRLLKTVQAGHMFRPTSPYSTRIQYLIYNKIRLAKTLFPKEFGDFLISKLPQDGNFIAACKLIEEDKEEIEEYAQYYKSIFTRDIYWLCKKFNICVPK